MNKLGLTFLSVIFGAFLAGCSAPSTDQSSAVSGTQGVQQAAFLDQVKRDVIAYVASQNSFDPDDVIRFDAKIQRATDDQGQAVFNVAGYFEVKTNLPTTPADQLASRLATFSNALNNQSGQQIFKHVVYFKAHAHIIEKLDGSSGLDINQVSSLDRPFGPASRSSQQAQVGSTSIPSVPIAPPSISTAVSEAQLKTPLQAERMSGNLPPSSQLPASVPVQHGPSFDCTRAATLTEKAICASPALSQMDYNIAAEYRTLRNRASRDKSQELLHSQRQWLIERNVRCSGDVNCLMQMLSDRTHELQRIAD